MKKSKLARGEQWEDERMEMPKMEIGRADYDLVRNPLAFLYPVCVLYERLRTEQPHDNEVYGWDNCEQDNYVEVVEEKDKDDDNNDCY